MQKILPLFTILTGFVLMLFKITEDREPGGIPLLLIFLGIAWYSIERKSTHSTGRKSA